MKMYIRAYIFAELVTVLSTRVVDKQWCYPVNSEFSYHITCKNTNYTSCHVECKTLGSTVDFANWESNLQYFGPINNNMIWTRTNMLTYCTLTFNDDTLISPSCSFRLRCLCRKREVYGVQRPQSASDQQGEGCQKKRNASTHIRTPPNNSEYFVTKNKTSYGNCTKMCGDHGAQFAELSSSFLTEGNLHPVQKLTGWVMKQGEANNSACHFAYKNYILKLSKCSRPLPCLCHNKVAAAVTGNSYTDRIWISVFDRQFLINNISLSYIKACDLCKNLGAAIVSFTNPVQYILLARKTPFRLLRGLYWVGGGFHEGDGKCLVLHSIGNKSLDSVNCKTELRSICSRVENVPNVLSEPTFVTLIKNMTVNRHYTTSMERKLTCAHDKRTSAKAVGVFIGTIVFSVVGGILL